MVEGLGHRGPNSEHRAWGFRVTGVWFRVCGSVGVGYCIAAPSTRRWDLKNGVGRFGKTVQSYSFLMSLGSQKWGRKIW